MTETERKEIETLPDRYRPLSAWSYFGYAVLFTIPVVGWVFLALFAISGSNVNRRSFARSYFCYSVLVLIAFAGMVALSYVLPSLASFFSRLFGGA